MKPPEVKRANGAKKQSKIITWRAHDTKGKRVRATLWSFFDGRDAVVFGVGLPVVTFFAWYFTGWMRGMFIAEAIVIAAVPVLLVFRSFWIRKAMIATTGTDVIDYEIDSRGLRFTMGEDKMEMPTKDIVVHRMARDVLVCKRTTLKSGNKLVLFFDSEADRDKVTAKLGKETTHGNSRDWVV